MRRNEINKKIRLLLDISGSDIGHIINYTRQAICNYERLGEGVRIQAKIEWYLDKRVSECDDPVLRKVCEYLQSNRNTT